MYLSANCSDHVKEKRTLLGVLVWGNTVDALRLDIMAGGGMTVARRTTTARGLHGREVTEGGVRKWDMSLDDGVAHRAEFKLNQAHPGLPLVGRETRYRCHDLPLAIDGI